LQIYSFIFYKKNLSKKIFVFGFKIKDFKVDFSFLYRISLFAEFSTVIDVFFLYFAA